MAFATAFRHLLKQLRYFIGPGLLDRLLKPYEGIVDRLGGAGEGPSLIVVFLPACIPNKQSTVEGPSPTFDGIDAGIS